MAAEVKLLLSTWWTFMIVFVGVITLLPVLAHRRCNHRPPKPHEVLNHIHLEPAHVVRKRSADQPLRVALQYDSSVFGLSLEKYSLIHNKVLPEAVNYWQQTLMVRETIAPIRLNRRCKTDKVFYSKNDPHHYCQFGCAKVTMCGEVVVPEEHLEQCRACNGVGKDCHVWYGSQGSGIKNADFVLYISAMQTERCHKGTVVAYAAHCQQESAMDRPIAGHANLCLESISTKPQELESLISTVKHEMLHALGFSVSLYAFYRDRNGNSLTPRGASGIPFISPDHDMHEWSTRVVRQVLYRDWSVRGGKVTRAVQMMVTPRVVEEVRNHFNCPILEGAELEDQGGEGTVLTHWEKRVFENEAMTGTHTQNPVYSRITLAMMEDTGWYTANYSMAEPLKWGSGLGCDFVMKSCREWIVDKQSRGQSPYPFCNRVKKEPPQTECMEHRKAVALCNLVEYEHPLHSVYQIFDEVPNGGKGYADRYGGSVDLADYCPYLQEFTWKSQNVVVRGSQCQYVENNPKTSENFALEQYGNGSLCFDHGESMWQEKSCYQSRTWLHWGSGCYKYSCLDGRLQIHVLNYTYACFYKGQEIRIQVYAYDWLHIGTVVCPSCAEICMAGNMKCLPEEKVTTDTLYHQDELPCHSCYLLASQSLTFLSLLMLHLCRELL